MRIVIVGPGAIGCLFAGFLAGVGKDVGLLDKNPGRVAEIAEKGVRVETSGGLRIERVAVSADPSCMGVADLLFVCVKSYDVAAAIRHALPVIGRGTIVVPLANGSGNVEKIAEVVAVDQIVCGITSHGSTAIGSGHVRHAGSGPTVLAAFVPGRRLHAEVVAGVLSESGMQARVADNMFGIIWSKLVVSAAINPLTAMLDVKNGYLLEDRETRGLMCRAVREAASVAAARGVKLIYADPVEEVEKVCRDTAHNISSMLQDVRKGRRTEVEAINGVIVEESRIPAIAVPINEMLLERVRGLDHSRKKGAYET